MTAVRQIGLALLMIGLGSCERFPVVTVTNRSGVALTKVVIAGSGFSERIGDLPSGAERSFRPSVRGESGVQVTFDAAGQHYDSGEQGYFEATGGYHVSVVIDPQMKVSVDSTF